jgi:hypothetical protein
LVQVCAGGGEVEVVFLEIFVELAASDVVVRKVGEALGAV